MPKESGIKNQAAGILVHDLHELHKQMKEVLEEVSERTARYYNSKRSQEPTLKEGDKVYLSTKFIQTKRQSKKLDHKNIGLYRIKKAKGRLNYELELPKAFNIYPTFHASLLTPAPPGAPPAPVVHLEPINPETEYEVERIINCRWARGKLQYLIHWKGCPDSERTWEPKSGLNCPALLADYHRLFQIPPKSTQNRRQGGRR